MTISTEPNTGPENGLADVLADIHAWHNRQWLHASSGTWVLAAGLWLIYIFPKLYRIPPALAGEPRYSQHHD